MKNIVHTLTLAQMRANPRRTLVTLVGVVLSVTMLTAVFAGADSFLNLLYRQAAQDNGTWHGRAFETGEQVVENLSQDDRIDQLGLAASWGVSPFWRIRSPRMDCGALIILSVRWGENCMTCWKVSRNGRQTCLSMLEAWGPSI